jgi:hypothetical protein
MTSKQKLKVIHARIKALRCEAKQLRASMAKPVVPKEERWAKKAALGRAVLESFLDGVSQAEIGRNMGQMRQHGAKGAARWNVQRDRRQPKADCALEG